MRLSLFVLTLGLLNACFKTDPVACTTEARASVQVTIVDQNGAPLVPTKLEFSVDGGAVQQAECIAGDPCTEYVLGWEQAGSYTISATYEAEIEEDPCCWFFDNQDAEVVVGLTEDECHVVTEMVTITLDTSAMVCADGDTGGCG